MLIRPKLRFERSSKVKTNDPKKRVLLESLKDGLIVSCQVQHDDPIYTDNMAVKMAEASQWAGAVGIRADSPKQIKDIKSAVNLPVIGLYKQWNDDTDVFITPNIKAVEEVLEAGADIVAIDCTSQISSNNRPAYELLPLVKKEFPEAIVFADISTYDEACRAVNLGADIVGPTLYGYTQDTKNIEQPNLREFARICRDLGDEVYVIMEGHVYTPEDAVICLHLGAHAVVVGSAITRPHLTAKRFVDLMGGYKINWRDDERRRH